VAGVGEGVSFSGEDVAKVGIAFVTDDFCAFAVFIRKALNCSGDFLVETGPTTVCIELRFRIVEWGVTSFA